MGLMDSLKGSLKDAAGDVYEYIDDKVDMPVIIGAFYPLRVTTHDTFSGHISRHMHSLLQ